jgi:hypothetical protein
MLSECKELRINLLKFQIHETKNDVFSFLDDSFSYFIESRAPFLIIPCIFGT